MNRRLLSIVTGVAVLIGSLFSPAIGAEGEIAEFRVPTAGAGPFGITAGRPGELWFTENDASKIGRITTAGTVTEFPLPAGAQPYNIVFGPDGNVWFTERGSNQIGRMTPEGTIVHFGVPTPASQPIGLAVGPNGQSLWFTEYAGNKIGRISLEGVITEFAIPTPDSHPLSITPGPDGNLWFTERTAHKIGRITPAGVINEYPTHTAASGPNVITEGPDGNLWFTEYDVSKIGRISPDGLMAEYTLPNAASKPRPQGIVAGPDGALWFTERYGQRVGKITTDGAIKQFGPLAAASYPGQIAVGSDNALWFPMKRDAIGRITTDVTTPGVTKHRRSVTLTSAAHVGVKGGGVWLKVKGRVRVHDGYQPCVRDKNRVVIERKDGSWTQVGEGAADADGAFSFDIRAHKPGLYRARVRAGTAEEGHFCLGAVSSGRRHSHRQAN